MEEYLHTSYSGTDREYRDGEVLERSTPDYSHGECQGSLVAFFVALKKRLQIFPCTEIRMRLPARRVLIPDVAVFHLSKPSRAPDATPLVAIEVLSPDDRLGAV